ncbi:MAG TPA: phosphoenolpyruvate--protein phosphotransferase [Novosphingobium sp.]|nr:phosphoenolpyruvate--protein phosphotransferase [Novosphingobium sp.]
MITIASPLTGWVSPLGDVPDAAFAQKMLGDGLAVDPVKGSLRAPGDGTIVSVHSAGHAVTIALDAGPVVLLHLGLDTVALGGKGFDPQCSEGQQVRLGEELIRFDLGFLARHARSLITPVIVTNGEEFRIVGLAGEGAIAAGDELLRLEPLVQAPVAAPRSAGGPRHERSLALPLAHGLHARPAARVAELAKGFAAAIELGGEGGRMVSARSAVAMLALSLRHGSRLTIAASGDDAEAAVAALAELIESGMGEYLTVADPVVAPVAPPPLSVPDRIAGITAVAGTVVGPAFPIVRTRTAPPVDAADAQAERAALDTALDQVRAGLREALANSGPQQAIAEAHLVLLDDPELAAFAQRHIAAGRSAGHAWNTAIESFARPLRASADKRFAERVADLDDLAEQVLAALAGEDGSAALPPAGAILVGEDLLPSHLMRFAGAQLGGLASGAGGASSHVAIIAAGLGLPMLCGLGEVVGEIAPGTRLAIHDGALLHDPADAEVARAQQAAAVAARLRETAQRHAHEPAITRDGTAIEVFANLGSADDARRAAQGGAEGCGLLRTEFLFLDRASPPSRDEQQACYQAIADALGPRPLIVRTLDIGADKPVPWLAQPHEENPALGLRGIRLQLANPALLEDQFGALLACNVPGGLKIMLPMVSELAEIVAARAVLESLAAAAGKPVPELGIMIETPAAALLAPVLAASADFFSIGSNDLSQYTQARDRTASSVACGLDGLHPAVLRLVAATVAGAEQHGRWAGLCGSLAADRLAIPVLIGLGLSELSVPPAALAVTKQVIRGLDLEQCRGLARQALDAPDAQTVRRLSSALLETCP